MKYKSFKFLKDLSFVRTAGSNEELQAACLIKEECEKLGIDAEIEEFEIDGFEIKECELKFEPEYVCDYVGTGFSGSTSADGVKGELVYIDSLQALEVTDVCGKIALVIGKLINVKIYKELVKKGCLAIIQATGDIYEKEKNTDLDPYQIREKQYKDGKIPCVCIRIHDAEKLVRNMPKTAFIKLIQEEKQVKSHNVVATIEGSKYPDEIIAFSAHFDSVSFSKGAYDNATGSTTILQVASYFMNHKPLRTCKFIWCGAEEMGLLGSKAYVNSYKDELNKYLFNINVDMTGVTLGHDIAKVTGDISIVNYTKYYALINGFALDVSQGVYSSDSTPFADLGVPSMSFARLSCQGGAVIHSRKDVLDFLSEKNYYRTCDFICDYSEKLINSVRFPVVRNIPENVKKDIDIYFGRVDK